MLRYVREKVTQFTSESKNNVRHGLDNLNKQTTYSCFTLTCHFYFQSMIYPMAAIFTMIKPNTSTYIHGYKCTSVGVFFQNFPFLVYSSHFLVLDFPQITSLWATSKLIYNTVIYIAKNGSLIAGFLSVLTVEDMSGGPPGSDSPTGSYVLLENDIVT